MLHWEYDLTRHLEKLAGAALALQCKSYRSDIDRIETATAQDALPLGSCSREHKCAYFTRNSFRRLRTSPRIDPATVIAFLACEIIENGPRGRDLSSIGAR